MRSFSLAFTGAGRELGRGERKIVGDALKKVKQAPSHVYSGAQIGVDTLAANYAMQLWPEAVHIVLVPTFCTKFVEGKPLLPTTCKYDEDGVWALQELAKDLDAGCRVRFAEPGIGKPAAGYLRRDDMLAQNCTHMMAFPPTENEQRRSGTWATVRKAVAQFRPVLVTPLNGAKAFKL